MAQRVAALYDIHGNVLALEAVLKELSRFEVDVVVVGGDLACGPEPGAVLERLLSIPGDVRFLRGNTDRWIIGAYESEEMLDDETKDVAAWCYARLSAQQRAFLSSVPDRVTLDVEGLGSTLFVHASPRSDREGIRRDAPEADIVAILQGVNENVVVCGHTHVQFDRRIADKRIVNPGSVGLPRAPKGACWALLGPDVSLFATDYDYSRAVERIRESGIPVAEHFIQFLA
jgi:putative phosphoesterase